ncbi:MAG: GlgB N-terminal domain-containing protein, partial [Lysobacteraceae bacterium]
MLDPGAVAALLAARHADPFAVLGLHADAAGTLWVRALLPGADSVDVLDAATGKAVTTLEPRRLDLSAGESLVTPLFEGKVPRRKLRFEYRLRVRWASGHEGVYADAYAFGPQITEDELRAFHEGHHTRPQRFLGAHTAMIDGVAGVRFAGWAPNARRVSVVGDVNGWDGRPPPLRLRPTPRVWGRFG